MRSPSSSLMPSASDERKQAPGKASGSGEEGAAVDPRGKPPKRAKVIDAGAGSAGAAASSAPIVVDTAVKPVSRVEDVDAPVLVSATDGERGTNAANARAGEGKGGGQDGRPPKNGSGGRGERVSPPPSPSISSPPSVVCGGDGTKVPSARLAPAKLSPETPALTAKALGEDAAVLGCESDAAQRTCLPSSASSSCSLSSASSVAVADAGAGGGRRRSSSGDGDRPERADERGAAAGLDMEAEAGTGAVAGGCSVEEHAAGAEADGGKGKKDAGIELPPAAGKSGAKAKEEPPEQGTAAPESSVATAAAANVAAAVASSSPSACGARPAAPAPARAGAGAAAPTAATARRSATQPPSALPTVAIVSSVAATANEQCIEKKVWLATFLECQRRELESTKESCRRELEALKQKLREKMKDAEDQQAKAREAFCGRLYGTDAAAAAAAAAVAAAAEAGAG